MRTIRSTNFDLDRLMMNPDDLSRYNGHHRMDKYHVVSGSDKPTIQSVPLDTPVNEIKEWLRPSSMRAEDIERWKAQPALKLLFIQTHNQFSANPNNNPSHRTIPGQTEVTPLDDREEQGKVIKNIFRHARLPIGALGSYIKAHLTFHAVPSYQLMDDEVNGGQVVSYYCSGTSWSIAWSYFHATRHTSAVMFYREGDGDTRRAELEEMIWRHREHIAHPMLLAYLKTHISLRWTFQLLDQMNGQTLAIEQSVGLATWDWVLDRPTKPQPLVKEDINGEAEKDPEEAVARARKTAVETYNILNGKLNNIRFRLRSFQDQLSWSKTCNESYLATLNDDEDVRKHECTEVGDILHQMTYLTNVHLHDADTLFDRLKQQMRSMAHLDTQRDTRISLAIADHSYELAWQSRGANRAMIAIAVVNSIFLPGTFVASVFDMPIFNWHMKETDVIATQPFWIYWLICGTLTGVLAAAWILFNSHRRKLDKTKREEAQKNFHTKVMRAPTLPKARSIKIARTSSNESVGWRAYFANVRRGSKNDDPEPGFGMVKEMDIPLPIIPKQTLQSTSYGPKSAFSIGTFPAITQT